MRVKICLTTYSLGINDINDSGQFTGIWAIVDKDNTTDFNELGEWLKGKEKK